MSAPQLKRPAREQLAAIKEVLRPWGLRHELRLTGKHVQVIIYGPRGATWRVSLSGSPRDQDAATHYARRAAQRAVDQINQQARAYQVERTAR